MRPQEQFVYVVKPQESHWTVGFGNGDNSGWFQSRREALESAVRDAIRVRELGYPVDVLVCRRDGTLRRVPPGAGVGSQAPRRR
ncbi:hypothetical protein [Azospirillum sp. ST 5-10]|uniref:hypothetical protein n=1 Tax=unclassified Azospirillum TaxID=2630922 RepID=UPI003F4A4BE4